MAAKSMRFINSVARGGAVLPHGIELVDADKAGSALPYT